MEILEDGLIFCRMDNNVPKDGYIRTARDLIVNADGSRGVRDSLHGSLNHAVMGHMLSSWDEHKYLYIIPIECLNSRNNIIFSASRL